MSLPESFRPQHDQVRGHLIPFREELESADAGIGSEEQHEFWEDCAKLSQKIIRPFLDVDNSLQSGYVLILPLYRRDVVYRGVSVASASEESQSPSVKAKWAILAPLPGTCWIRDERRRDNSAGKTREEGA